MPLDGCVRQQRGETRRAGFLVFGAACWVVLLVVSALQVHGGPARQALGVLGIVVFALAWKVVVVYPALGARQVVAAALVCLAAAGALLEVVAPAGQVYAVVFAVCAVAPVRLPYSWARAVATISVLIGLPAFTTQDGNNLLGGLLIAAGAGFFFLMSAGAVASRQALARAEEMREAQAQAAALDERGRIARELHDVLAHTLSGLAVQVEGARLLAQRRGADPELVRRLAEARQLAVSGLDEARRAVGALRDDKLPGPGQLSELVTAYGEQARLSVVGDPRPVPPSVGVAVYRTAQEALTNARRHAGGPEVEVALAWTPSTLRLVVADRGGRVPVTVPAVDLPGSGPSGHGLIGMRERAELAGGRLTAGPSDEGWTVTLELPA